MVQLLNQRELRSQDRVKQFLFTFLTDASRILTIILNKGPWSEGKTPWKKI